MSWREDVDGHLETIIPSKPVYVVNAINGGSCIHFSPISAPHTDSKSKIAQMLLQHAIEHVEDGKHELAWSGGPHGRMWSILSDSVHGFISDYYPTKQIRSTSLWRWYNTNLVGDWKNNLYEQFQEDIWAWFKWVWDRDDRISEKETKAALKLLEVIKNKYEAKGVKK